MYLIVKYLIDLKKCIVQDFVVQIFLFFALRQI